MNQINNKRIAKNTILLYIRMMLILLVSLYTSRIVLDKLGVTDYGIYNVVAGVVAMLGFLNGSMANAVQRYLSFELGKENDSNVRKIFNVSILAHLGIAIIVFIIMELIGVWYLNNYMVIPKNRLEAANWVLQCSIITTIFTIIQVPYNALIIAKEQMGIYAYISILEVVLKLIIVYFLSLLDFDKLKLYSILIMLVTLLILSIYKSYCTHKFKEAKFKLVSDKKMLSNLLSFASWNMLGEIAWVFTGQGVNIILNLFFGPTVNAARGLADQINAAVMRFISNFQTAVNPQLIKSYASNQLQEMKLLLFRSIKFSFFLMLLISMPLILKMDFILNIWLKEVPKYAVEFCQLVLICSLTSTISNLFSQIARAYGKIRNYQIIVSTILFLNFPLSYIALKIGASPLSTMLINISIQLFLIYVRLHITCKMIELNKREFTKRVLYPIISVTFISSIIPLIVCHYSNNTAGSFIIICALSIISVILTIYFIGINKDERQILYSFAKKISKKIF